MLRYIKHVAEGSAQRNGSIPKIFEVIEVPPQCPPIRGAFSHNWDPYWSSSVWGGYSSVRYKGNAPDITSTKGQWCASYNTGKAVSADYTCNPAKARAPHRR
jgi:hypothetical protein